MAQWLFIEAAKFEPSRSIAIQLNGP